MGCVKKERKWREREMEWEVVSREMLDGKGYSTRGRMNC